MAMVEPVIPLNEEVEHETKEKVLQRYFLQEWELVKSLIDVIVADRRVSDVSAVHKIRSIVDKYQEQGQLLEPFLQSTISPLMSIVQSRAVELITDSKSVLEVIKPICIIIYSLVTVCGYKVVIKFFPHQVSDLELAVSLLEMCHAATSSTSLREESTGEMEAKCVILLWLSILVLVPFDISSVDSSIVGDHLLEGAPPPLVLNILKFCKDYLSNAGPMRTISGLVLSRLLTRPDMSKAFSSFIEWAHEVLSYVKEDVMDHHFRLLGAVEALAAIFKAGSKKVLVDVVPLVWGDISALMKSGIASRSPLLRKYLVKLSQRIALTCLPHRSPSWRYVGRNSTLRANVSQNASIRAQSPENNGLDVDSISDINFGFQQEEDMDIPDTIEEMIELLLSGLRDTDTVVRWSAAKGIGRVSSSLTYNFSDEVLSSVLELFSPGEGDGSWHGGCLALAELARRGVLLPVNFPKVVPVVIKALHYDIRRGPHSVGSHVRDAAAYVCWAFGRAYYHRDMRSILEDLAPHLLTVACYDREVNCRRAAAAAFQENVGRQGNYPHGIDIVNTADYFALSSRSNSYLYVAISIAQHDGYLHPFINELLENKICHWEKGLRELAANALAGLVKYDPQYFADSVLEELIPCTLSSDLCKRHGATLAVGELVSSLHQCNHVLSSDQQKHVAGLVPAIEKARLYRGKGGEIMRSAVSRFIDCISLAHIHLPEKVKRSLLDTLNENLRHPNSQIQNAAVEALKTFIPAYYTNAEDKIACDILFKYQEQLKDPNVAARRGSSLAIGVLPYQYLSTRWKVLLPKLCTACAVEENPEDRDVEARVNAVKGLISVCETLAESPHCSIYHTEEDKMPLLLFIKNEVIQCLFKALDDYSVDNRGDVGSWVRGAAIDGLERCTYILCKRNSKPTSNENEKSQTFALFDDKLATNLVSCIVKQAVEKMDKIRETAAKVLQRILHSEYILVPYIPYREKLEEIIPNNVDIEWAVPTISFPYLILLLQFSCYSKFVLSGLVISVGGLQDSLRKASLTSLLWYLDDSVTRKNTNQISREFNLSNDIIWLLQEYKRCDRVIIPTLKTIEILMSKKFFLNMEAQTDIFCNGIRESLNVELKGTKDFSKLYSGISILGYISSIPCSTNLEAFSQLLTLLGHRFPKIRKASAEQVYLVLLQNSSIIAEDKIEKALEIISETCWEGDIEEAKQQRSELKAMAGLEETPTLRPDQVIMSKNNNEKKPIIIDENASYASLVDSNGF